MKHRKFTEDDFLYPESDDLPTAESDLHRKTVMRLIEQLDARYESDPDVYVSGEFLIDSESGLELLTRCESKLYAAEIEIARLRAELAALRSTHAPDA